MCVKFHDEENRLEIMGGASCLYDSVLPIYVSKEKVLFNSDKYLNDVKEANAILKELEKRLQS